MKICFVHYIKKYFGVETEYSSNYIGVTKWSWPSGKRVPAGASVMGSIPFGHP